MYRWKATVGLLLFPFRGPSPYKRGEIAQRGGERLIVAAAYLPVAGEVGKEYVVDEFAQPWGVADRDAGGAVGERIFRGVPELRVDVGVGGGAEVAHGGAARIGCDAQRGDARLDGVEVVFILCRRGRGNNRHDCGGEHQPYSLSGHVRNNECCVR